MLILNRITLHKYRYWRTTTSSLYICSSYRKLAKLLE